jgi:HD superfamily phosphohydrolase
MTKISQFYIMLTVLSLQLYDIVNNRHSGLDVDKIDYYTRDGLRAFGNKDEAFKLITDARVAKCRRPPDECTRSCDTPGIHYTICYPSKRVIPVMAFFKKRLELHESIYQNKKTVSVESLVRRHFVGKQDPQPTHMLTYSACFLFRERFAIFCVQQIHS